MFLNRQQAGKLLAGLLRKKIEKTGLVEPDRAVVVALPRGGVPVAAEIARDFQCSLEILVSKKIRAPDNPELAIGAVSSGGVVVLDEQIPRILGFGGGYEEAQRVQTLHLIEDTRQQELRWIEAAGMKPDNDWQGSLVIVTDDGIATGMTTIAALRTVKQRGAGKVWLAAPVAPYETCEKLKVECDEIVVLSAPFDFTSVGGHYVDFHQVSDEEVIETLRSVSPVES